MFWPLYIPPSLPILHRRFPPVSIKWYHCLRRAKASSYSENKSDNCSELDPDDTLCNIAPHVRDACLYLLDNPSRNWIIPRIDISILWSGKPLNNRPPCASDVSKRPRIFWAPTYDNARPDATSHCAPHCSWPDKVRMAPGEDDGDEGVSGKLSEAPRR